jgi:ABC-type thiamin/hydroxymethylpyrimidine transport system permease subunit
MPGNALSQGQIVALAMMAAGCLGLLVLAVWHARDLKAMAATRIRPVLVGALLLSAGLALLLVRRLDPAVLSRVLAGVTAALLAASPAPSQWKELR